MHAISTTIQAINSAPVTTAARPARPVAPADQDRDHGRGQAHDERQGEATEHRGVQR